MADKPRFEFFASPWAAWALFALGLLLYGMNLGARDFWSPDEPDYALVAQDMKKSGDYILPTFDGHPYYEKPPLLYWSSLLCQAIFGQPHEFSARLPSVFAGAFGLVLIFLLGRKMFSAQIGFLAALILGTSFQYLWRSSYLQTDMLFTVFCLGAFYLLWGILEEEKRRFYPRILLFYLVLALGVLTKGPLILVLTGLTVFFFSWRQPGPTPWQKLHLKKGLLVLGLVAGWWFAAVWYREGWNFIQGQVIREHLMRFWDSDSHNRPLLFYFSSLWYDLAPWSLFLPFFLWAAWRNRAEPELKFLCSWFLGGFLFFCLTSSKQGKYLLPLFPAAALMISWGMLELGQRIRTARLVRYGLDGLGVLFILLGVSSIGLSLSGWMPATLVESLEEAGVEPDAFFPLLAILHGLVTFGLLAMFLRNRNTIQRVGLLAGGIAVSFLVFAHFYPEMNGIKSARPFMERIASSMEPEARLGTVNSFRGAFAYYTGHSIERLWNRELWQKFFADPRPAYALITREEYDDKGIRPEPAVAHWKVDEGKIGHRRFYLFSNRPPGSYGKEGTK